MEVFDIMDWEPTLAEQTEITHRVLTPQCPIFTGPVRSYNPASETGAVFPNSGAPRQPIFPRKKLERSSPQRHWKELLAQCNVKNRRNHMELNKNGTNPGPCLPLNMESTNVTPRKRVIEDVYYPELVEDPAQQNTLPNSNQQTSQSNDNMIESPKDISMQDVFDSPESQPVRQGLFFREKEVEGRRPFGESAARLGSFGTNDPFRTQPAVSQGLFGNLTIGEPTNRLNFTAPSRLQSLDLFGNHRSEAPTQHSHQHQEAGPNETVDINPSPVRGGMKMASSIEVSTMPGSWPISPPPSPERSIPSSPVNDFHESNAHLMPKQMAMMSGALLDMPTGVKPGTIMPTSPPNGLIPAEYPKEVCAMRSPTPENGSSWQLHAPFTGASRIQNRVLNNIGINGWPRRAWDISGGWVVQKAVRVAQTVKRRALSIVEQHAPSGLKRRVTRRGSGQKQDKKIFGLSPEQRRQLKARQLREERKSLPTQPYPEQRNFELQPPPLLSSQQLIRPSPSRRASIKRPIKSSTHTTVQPLPVKSLAPGRVTKRRADKASSRDKQSTRGAVRNGGPRRIVRPSVRLAADRDVCIGLPTAEQFIQVNKMNLQFINPPSPIVPREDAPKEAPALSTPTKGSMYFPGPDSQPSQVVVTPPDESTQAEVTEPAPLDEAYEGYTPSPSHARRRVRWHHSDSPLGRPIAEIRVYNPESPVGKQAVGATTDEQPISQSPEGSFIKPLSEKWESRLETSMGYPDHRQAGTTINGDPLNRKDIATCYTPLAWLNDEIINAYLAIILDYARRVSGNSGRHQRPKFHAFNSFFYSSLRDRGYESVRRWATRAKIGGRALLDMDMIFIPVHNQAHWTLMVIKPSARTIEYFDSLGGTSRAHVTRAKDWLRGELRDLFVEEDWRVLPSVSPQQNNGSDCGVFLLTTAKLVALRVPLNYGAKDIPLIRKRIVAELLNGGFEGDFDPKVDFPVKSML